MCLYLELVRLTFFPRFLLIADFYKNQFTQLTKSSRRGKATTTPQRLVAFLNSSNEIFSVYRLNIIFASLIESKFLGLSICMRQISQDVLLTLQCAEFIGNIQNTTSATSDNYNIVSPKFHPSSIANALLYRLVEFGIRNTVFFTLNHSIGTLALVITENNNIRTICRQTIRYSHFYFNPIDRVFVFINQLSPKFSTDLFFRIAIIFYMVIRRNICDFLFAFFSNNMCITIFYCSFEICHLSSS